MKFLTLILFLLYNINTTYGQSSYANEELKLLSWNIYMLPSFVYFTGKRQRADAIGDYLKDKDYDVIVFQEAFKHGARRRIKRDIKSSYPYRIGPAYRRYITLRTSSGIWIASKHPMQKIGATKYKLKEGFDNKMARKGALYVSIQKNGKEYHIIGTHLNAGGSDTVKRSQVTQIKNLVQQHQKAEIPIFICGDFNIHKPSSNYEFILNSLGVEDGNLNGNRTCTVVGTNDLNNKIGKCEIIDFIFYKPNGITYQYIERKLPLIEWQWSSLHKSLSDHEPVELYIKF